MSEPVRPPLLPPRPGRGFRARLLALLLGLGCFTSIVLAQGQRGDEPLPLQRVLVPPRQIPAELEKARRGVLVQMPREEFEAKVSRAQKAVEAARTQPSLVRATYSVELVGQALTAGSGQWTVVHSGTAPGVLPLPSLNLALARAKWDHGAAAVVGELDGQHLGLLLDRPGTATCFFDWSARGIPAANGLNFDLHFPACPLTVLELKLPADHWLVVPRQTGALVSRQEAEVPNKQLWRLQVTGRTQLEFAVRRLSEVGGAVPRLLAQVRASQVLTPARVLADFDLQIEPLQGSPRELVFEMDPELQPYEVTGRDTEIAGYQWQPPPAVKDGKDKKTPVFGTLTVRLPEPVQGVLKGLRIRCLAPRLPDQNWASPGLRLRNAGVRTETLKIHIHPDLQLGTWNAGDFRLTGTITEADGTQILNLVDTRNSGPPSRRPVAGFRAQGIDLHARQRTRWQLAAGGMELWTEVNLELARGPLHRLTLQLPSAAPPYQVESVETEPRDLLRGSVVAGPLLLVDLQRGLTPRSAATLKVRLRASDPRFDAKKQDLAIPDIEPLDASLRDGTLEVSADPVFQVQLKQFSLRPTPAVTAPEPGAGMPCFAFTFRGKGVSGTVHVEPQRSRLRVRAEQEVALEAQGGTWKARLDLEPALGHPDHVDLYLSRPVLGAWQVRTDDPQFVVRQVHRLAVPEVLPQLLHLGITSGLDQAALAASLPHGQLWRLQFAQRLSKKATLLLEAPLLGNDAENLLHRLPLLLPPTDPWSLLTLAGAGPLLEAPLEREWRIPLLTGRDLEEFDADVAIRATDQPLLRARAAGLEAVGLARMPGELRFRYRGLGSGTSSDLVVWTQPRQHLPAGEAVCDEARLVTSVEVDGTLHHHLSFRLWNWRQSLCLLELRSAAEVLAARVDGYWLSGLVPVTEQGVTLVQLPILPGGKSCRVELLYRTRAERDSLGFLAATAADPVLPAKVMGLQRRWRLAPGLWPLAPERLHRPGGPTPVSVLTGLYDAWHLGDEAFASLSPDARHDHLAKQRSRVLGSDLGLRPRLSRQTRLGVALEQLDLSFLKGTSPLVIDRAGLAEAGVHPGLPLGPEFKAAPDPRPFWEAVGLVYVPCARGALLTTPQQLHRWQELGADAQLDRAVEEALHQGIDRAGAFVSLSHWLRHTPAPDGRSDLTSATALLAGAGPGSSDWETYLAMPADAPLWVVPTAPLSILGWLLAAVVAALAWARARWLSPVRGFRAHVVALLLLSLAAVWLPATLRELCVWPPLLVGCIAFVWLFLSTFRQPRPTPRTSRSTMIRPPAVLSLLLLGLGALPWFCAAQQGGAAPYWVLLVGEEGSEQQSALVTPDLLKKLEEMEDRAPLAQAGAVLVGATYQARVRDQSADVEAVFEVYTFKEQTDLVVPLLGVQLKEGAFLDGAPVYPVANPQGGYRQPIRGKGSHHLRLAFSIRAAAVGDYLEVRCGIPKLPQCRLDVTWAAPVSGQQLVHCQGDDGTHVGGKQRPESLHAQLGAEGVLQLRWLAGTAPAQDKAVEIREAYFWDLRPGVVSLTGALQYSIVRGALASLAVDVPDGIEVRDVTTSAGPVVRSWHVVGKDNQRQLRIELSQPASGNLVCLLDLVPRLQLTPGDQLLRLPLPRGGKTTEGFVGYRLDALDASDRALNLSVTSLAPDQFAKDWAKRTGRELSTVTRAFAFRRIGPQAALGLGLQPRRPQSELETTWTVHTQYAEVKARATLSSPADDLLLLEARVPAALSLTDVSGSHVHHWNLQDGLLQVWLTQPRKQVALEISGWVKMAAKGRLVLPHLQLLQVHQSPERVLVRSDPGIQVEAEKVRNLTPAVGAGAALTYTAEGPYDATFLCRAAPAPLEARLLTTVEGRQEHLELRCYLQLVVPHDLKTLKVHVADWPADGPRLDVSAPVQQRPHMRAGAKHTWSLTFPPGIPSHLLLTVHGRMAVPRGQELRLPTVTLEPATAKAHWLVVRALDGPPVLEGPARPGTPPTDGWLFGPAAERALQDGKIWLPQSTAAPLAIRVPAVPTTAQTKILLAQQEAGCIGPGQWLHEVRYLVHTRTRGELHLALPDGARWLAAAVDGQPVLPAQPAPAEVVLPLPDGKAPCLVQVRWDYPPGTETTAQPERAAPRVVGGEVLARQARYHLPASQRPIGPLTEPNPEAQELYELARTYLRLSALLAGQESGKGPALLAAQQHFYGALRHLEQALLWQVAAHEADNLDALQEKGRQLRQENLASAKTLGYEQVRDRADKEPWAVAVSRLAFSPLPGGTPIVYDPGAEVIVPPRLRGLLDDAAAERRLCTELLLVLAVALLLLTYVRPGLALARSLWPEILAVTAGLGLLVGGVSLVGIALLIGAAGARLFLLGRRMRAWFARPAQEESDEALSE